VLHLLTALVLLASISLIHFKVRKRGYKLAITTITFVMNLVLLLIYTLMLITVFILLNCYKLTLDLFQKNVLQAIWGVKDTICFLSLLYLCFIMHA